MKDPRVKQLAEVLVNYSTRVKKGDVVALCDAEGQEFARGLSNYSADDARKIATVLRKRSGDRVQAVDSAGAIYVIDAGKNRLVKLAAS